MKKNLSKSLSAFAFMLISSISILAQTTATIGGHVTNPKGANVTGATVTLYSRDSRVLITTTTDANGAYRFQGISPGEYVLPGYSAGLFAAPRRVRTAHR